MNRLLALSFACAVVLPLAAENVCEQGKAALQRSEYDKAVQLLEGCITQQPNSAEWHYWLGDAYGSQAQSASMFSAFSLATKAKEQLDIAVRLDPNHIPARFGMLQFYLFAPSVAGGSESKAIEQANEIKKRDSFQGHRAWAIIYSHQKKTDLMRKEYVDALHEQPNSAKAHSFYANLLLLDKNYKGAVDEYETALKLDASYMPPMFRLGQVAALSGINLPHGEEMLKKYLVYIPKADEPPLSRAHYWLGMIYEKQGRKAEAKQSYAASLKLNPKQKDVSEAMKRVS